MKWPKWRRYLPELANQASNGEITLKGEGRPDGIFSAKVQSTVHLNMNTLIHEDAWNNFLKNFRFKRPEYGQRQQMQMWRWGATLKFEPTFPLRLDQIHEDGHGLYILIIPLQLVKTVNIWIDNTKTWQTWIECRNHWTLDRIPMQSQQP